MPGDAVSCRSSIYVTSRSFGTHYTLRSDATIESAAHWGPGRFRIRVAIPAGRRAEVVPIAGDRGFESFSLQRRVGANLTFYAAPCLRLRVSRKQPVQWKTRGQRYRELRRLKVPERSASAAIFSPKGPWRLSFSEALHRAFTKARFRRLGLLSMEKLASA